MKYKPEDYSISDSGFYGIDDGDIENYKEKLVKCRKPHKCMGGCEKEIVVGSYAIRESGFMDGQPISSYTCTDCMDKWLDEINEDDEVTVVCSKCSHFLDDDCDCPVSHWFGKNVDGISVDCNWFKKRLND